MGYDEGGFPVSESINVRLLRLPLYYELNINLQQTVAQLIHDFFNKVY